MKEKIHFFLPPVEI